MVLTGGRTTEYGLECEFGFEPRFKILPNGPIIESLKQAIQELHTLDLDYAAFNVFLRIGFFLANDTPFRQIRRVGPHPRIAKSVDLTREQAMDAYIDLFRQAVARRSGWPTALALSGGRDSRHILLELHRSGHLPEYVVTVPLAGRPTEAAYAAELAQRVKIRHFLRYPDPKRSIPDEIWKNHAVEFCSTEHGWFSETAQQRDHHLPWWDGIGGGVLSAGAFLDEWNVKLFEEGRLDEFADRMVPGGDVPYFRDQSLFPREDAVHAVRKEAELHAAAPNPVGSFYFWNRTRNTIGPSAFRMLGPTLAPYLDRDVWTLLAGLPARMLIDHSFHTQVIALAYPEFADIPYFEASEKIHQRVPLIVAAALFQYAFNAPFRRGDRLRTLLRILRSVSPSHRDDLKWLLPITVYFGELEVLESLPKIPRSCVSG